MQLREIHIDGFGVFSDRCVTGLEPGVNVLFGANEQGKTTLLEFIRRVLFGFPHGRKKTNLYTPVAGGAYGGRLVCLTRAGETVTIVRGEGRKGGVVRLETPQGRREGQEAVDALLHASEELFRNVYAFTLDELQDAASLKEEAVRGRMYGAGLGLGRVSLDEVEKGFRQRCEALFKPRGANPLMNRLAQEAKGLQSQIQDLQQDLGRFEALDTQAAKLAQESRALETSIGEHEESLRQLDLRLRLYEPFVDLERVRGQLEEMGDVPAFPETAFQLHEDLQKDLRRYRRQFEEERDRLAKWRAEVQALRFSPALLDRAGDVATVRGMLSQVNAAIADQRPLELERSRLDDQIQVDIKAAGLTWDEKRVREFQLSEGDLEDVRELGQSRARLGQKRDAVKSKLEFHREQKAAARLRGMAVPSWLRAFVWVVLSFGLAGTGAGAALGDPNVLGIAVGVLILGGFLLFKTYRRAADFQMDDPVEAHLLKEHKMSVMEYEAKLEEWDRWLEAHDLKEGVSGYLTPNKMEPLRQRVRGIQERIREREDLDARLRQMRDKVEEARTRMQDLSGCVDGVRPAGEIAAADLATQMNLVCLTFDQHRQKRDQRLTLEAKIAEQEAKVAHISEYIAAGEDARQKLFLSADAGSEEEFLERRRRAERRRELETKFAGCKKEIELGAGVGPAFDAFVASLRERPRLDWEGQREQTSTALAALKDQRDAMNQAIGHLRAERERLASGDALLARQSELEMKRTELGRASRLWAESALAQAVLERAKDRYEKTRQPPVIREASRVFAAITGGRYRKIIKATEGDDLFIEDDAARRKGLLEMSRGTREQLYLAMRLGLIEEYESRAEPLPLIMDDVFVNFDEVRRANLLQRLQTFAASRQVLILTCHQASLDLYRQYGAKAIAW